MQCLDERFVGPFSDNDESQQDLEDNGFDVDSDDMNIDDDRDDDSTEGSTIESHREEEEAYEGGGDDERDTYPYWL